MSGSQHLNIRGGVKCADFVGRDQIKISYGFSTEDVSRLIDKVLAFLQAGAVFLPAPWQPDMLQIEHDGQTLTFQPGAARQLANQNSLQAYLLALTVDQEYQRWATRFVPLAGKLDIRQVIEGLPIAFSEILIPTGEAGLTTQPTQRPLGNIAEAMQSYPAFVILGEPGAGKTTTQQKLAYDAARALLEGKESRVPLFVRLSEQKQNDPYHFLQTEWEQRTGEPFARALANGQILILADGINEIPRQQRNECLHAWMLFEQQYRGANQLIFSGRENDYDNQLNLPRVLVEPLDEARISAFLERHGAEALSDLLSDPANRLRDLARNPLNLFVLVMVFLQCGKNLRILAIRGRLFQAFALALLHHEQLWHPDLLSVDSKVDLFAALAYQMQQQGTGTTFSVKTSAAAVPATIDVLGEATPVDPVALFRFGRGASILDPATLPDVRFYHHLLQEYFAARELLRQFNLGEDLSTLWKAPRQAAEMPESKVGAWDPLPEPPTTGWEVTTLLACGLARDPARLVAAVRQHNPVLAGRCLVEAGIEPPDSEKEAVADSLLRELYDPAVHLRARLQAGYVLGQVGDPRFKPQMRNGVQVILPHLVAVPAGRYTIGSANNESGAYEYEKPQHIVDLPAFSIGKWPVTNAEYACFMQAGGYEDERWWATEQARRWLKGEEVPGGQVQAWVDVWKQLQSIPDVRQALEAMGNFSPDQVDLYETVAKMTEAELKDKLSHSLSQKSRRQPHYWDKRQYNNPSQPVVGVTWFEASAYCAWLSLLTGRTCRLPTEVEWEAAARGLRSGSLKAREQRIYPWMGEWDPAKANTLEGRVLKPSPVGAYAAVGGVGPFGAEDQAGNVWEWTASIYLPYSDHAENSAQSAEDLRVLRGGSWCINEGYARCAYRDRGVPFDFNGILGFRMVVCPSSTLNCDPLAL